MDNQDASQDDSRVTYRSGVAARLAGLSVETLRVWERRYQLSDTERSERGQRLYSGAQVRKLGLLKQLVDQGHAISVLARLSGEQLQELAAGTRARPQAEGPLRVTVIGGSLAKRIAASGREGLDLIVQGSYPHLEQASGQSLDAATE